MYNDSMEQEEEDEPMAGGLHTRFGRWWDQLTGRVPEEDEYEENVAVQATRSVVSSAFHQASVAPPPPAAPPRRDTFRIASAREGSITVMPVSSFGDVQKAADRLKSGEPQIINLEKSPPEVAERLIDFLNGVTYALDGYVEKIAESAYLFTPSHIAINAEGPEVPAPKPFFDRL